MRLATALAATSKHQTLHVQVDGQVVPGAFDGYPSAVALLGLGAYLRRCGS